MRGYSLPVQSIIMLLKSFESLTTTSKTVNSSSMAAASNALMNQSLSLTRAEVITCHSTNNVNEAQLQARRAQTFSPLADSENDVSGSSEDSGEHDVDMDVSEAMSESALIAFSYCLHNSEGTMTSQSQSSSSQQALMTIDGASCLPASRSLSELETAELGSFHSQTVAPLKRSKRSPELHSMLCNATPVIIDLTQEKDDGYGVLQDYRRIPQNIILDSLYPQLTPHIVITPADDEGDLFEVYQNNRAGPQYFPYLPVPPFFGSTCRMHTYEEYTSLFYLPNYCQQPGPSRAHYRKVGSFQSLSQISDWQSFIHGMAHILSLKLHKQVVIEASLKASAFRVHYDVPEFIEHVGWQDPADALFAHRRKFCTWESVVIGSDSPRVVPHIIIDFAPRNDVVTSSAYPGPSCTQDQAFLIAPLPYEHMNTDMNMDSHSLADLSSDASSVGPQTPTELQRVGSGFFAELTEDVEEDITSAYGGYKEYRMTTGGFGCSLLEDRDYHDAHDIQEEKLASSPKFFISSNDDDDDDDWDADDLPDMETDPWFIEARARSAAAALLMSC